MGTENSVPEEEDSGRPCTQTSHAYSRFFKCDQQNCETFICKKCMGREVDGRRFCVLCTVNFDTEQEQRAESEILTGKAIGKFQTTISVQRGGDNLQWD